MKKSSLILCLIALCALSSCSLLNTTTRGTAYPKMYEEKPTSILIMPPINNTNAVEAKDYFYRRQMMKLEFNFKNKNKANFEEKNKAV